MESKIKQLIEDGFSCSKIADKFSVSRDFVQKLVTRNKWSLKKEYFSLDKVENICQLYKDGVSAKQLGIKYSIDKRRVQKWAKENGNLRSKNESHRITYFNEHAMDIIDTPAKAYWLGFFYADAYNADQINTFNITLKGSDHHHLEKCAEFFNLPKNKVDLETNEEGYTTTHISFYSKHLCTKMTELGCPRAKSFITKYPEWLYKSLNFHFIRGLSDGDGGLTIRSKSKEWNWYLTGTRELCEFVASLLKKENINSCVYSISKTNNNTCSLEVTGNQQVQRVCNWLYRDSTEDIRLDRKYERYQQLCEQQRNRVYWGNMNSRTIDFNIPNLGNRGTAYNDRYTVKSMLGPLAKNISLYNGILIWQINNKHSLICINDYTLTEEDFEYLKQFESIRFYYLSPENLDFLVKHDCKVEKSTQHSYILSISEINYSGNKKKTVRNYMNRYENLLVKDSYNSLDDINLFIDRWSETLGEKYFRDYSNRNKFFFKNDFHSGCECVFVYDKERLVSFGVASPVEMGYCSYIIGKALAFDYRGLSEFTDMKLYEKLFNKYGAFNINMGQGEGSLAVYKQKFHNATDIIHYNGKVKF